MKPRGFVSADPALHVQCSQGCLLAAHLQLVRQGGRGALRKVCKYTKGYVLLCSSRKPSVASDSSSHGADEGFPALSQPATGIASGQLTSEIRHWLQADAMHRAKSAPQRAQQLRDSTSMLISSLWHSCLGNETQPANFIIPSWQAAGTGLPSWNARGSGGASSAATSLLLQLLQSVCTEDFMKQPGKRSRAS